MGWYIIIAPSKVKKEKETAIGQMCIDIFENDWTNLKSIHIVMSLPILQALIPNKR
jgi:hypothetical protein